MMLNMPNVPKSAAAVTGNAAKTNGNKIEEHAEGAEIP
jgi:hypothetical protein